MKKILLNLSSYIFPCFTREATTENSSLEYNNTILSKINLELNSNINLDILPRLNNPTLVKQGSSLNNSPVNGDFFFLNNNPETYKNMLDNYINYHGKDSLKIKGLISEEQDIADRIYNIHTITGNNTNPNLLRTLKSKEYILDKDISSITNTCGHSVSSNTSSITVELSPGGDTLDITSLPDIISYASTIFGG